MRLLHAEAVTGTIFSGGIAAPGAGPDGWFAIRVLHPEPSNSLSSTVCGPAISPTNRFGPAGRDDAQREAMLHGKSHAVHFVGEQRVRIERLLRGELIGCGGNPASCRWGRRLR